MYSEMPFLHNTNIHKTYRINQTTFGITYEPFKCSEKSIFYYPFEIDVFSKICLTDGMAT